MDFDWHWPNGDKVVRGRRFAYDIETNGLMPDVNTIHSLVLEDLDTGEVISCVSREGEKQPTWGPHYCTIGHGLKLLQEAQIAFGHNILNYDGVVIRHLHPDWTEPFSRDTLILSKMIWPTDKLKDLDWPRWRAAQASGHPEKFPGQLVGAHKLEAWGYRLGEMKGDYSDTVKKWSKVYAESGTLDGIPEDFHVLASTDAKGRLCLDPWKAWNKPMQDYCEQDVRVTVKFLKLCISHLDGTNKTAMGRAWSPRSVDLEHHMWVHIMKQEARGFGYDLPSGHKLAATLKNRKAELEEQIRGGFGSWWEPLDDIKTGHVPAKDRSVKRPDLPDVTVPRLGASGKPLTPYRGPPKEHYSVEAPFVRIERKQLNPGSPRQLGDRLIAVYGWQPSDWVGLKDENGKGTQAKLDETVLQEMEDSILPPELKAMILEFLIVKKTLGALADGSKAWNGFAERSPDGNIHGRMDTLGTVSHRGAHKDPNLGNIPGVSVDEIKNDAGEVVQKVPIRGWKGGFGVECRSLFGPSFVPSRKRRWPHQTGVDASGLQLRCLGHHLYPYDEGAFAKRVSTPGLDIHAENGKLCGLNRKDTKKTTYTWLFGAGPPKIGITVGLEPGEEDIYCDSEAAKSYLRFMRKVMRDPSFSYDKRMMAYIGKGSDIAKRFVNGIDGLKELRDTLKKEAEEYGCIMGLDGRKLYIRKPHAVLNQALQGDEAVITKVWQLETDRLLQAEGLKEDWDYGQMAWVHDEAQWGHEDGLSEVIARCAQQAMENTQGILDYKCPLMTEAKDGLNWFECH